jgi:hypothetical protein
LVLALGTDRAGGTPDTTVADGTVIEAGTAVTDIAAGMGIAVATVGIVAAMAADTGADLLPMRAADSTAATVVDSTVAEGSAVVAVASMAEADSMAADTDSPQT